MKHIAGVILGLGIGLFLFAGVASAGPIIRGGEMVSIDASQSLDGDFYGFGSTITLSGAAGHDVYALGGTVTVNAPVSEDLTIVGGSVQVHTDIGDDMRVLGGEVTLGGTVKGDVAVVGGVLTILSTAKIEGDILFFGGSLVVEGDVVGTVHGFAESVRINATIGGDIEMTASQGLTLNDRAEVRGDITYKSAQELSRAQNAVVEGDIQKRDMDDEDSGSSRTPYLFVLSTLFMAASLFFIARSSVERFCRESFARIGQNGLIGLAMLLVLPFVSVVLLVSFVGIPLGILLFLAFLSLITLSFGLTPILIGYLVERTIVKQDSITLRTIIIGVVVNLALMAIPFGLFVLFALNLITLGTVGIMAFRLLRG
jgi:cytoskeletal protein CcmA (bactofilin family)